MPLISAPPNQYDKYAVFIRSPAPDRAQDGEEPYSFRMVGPFGTAEQAGEACVIIQREEGKDTYVRWGAIRVPGPEDESPVRLVRDVVPDGTKPIGVPKSALDENGDLVTPNVGSIYLYPRIAKDADYDIGKVRTTVAALRDILADQVLRVTLSTMFDWMGVSRKFRRDAGWSE